MIGFLRKLFISSQEKQEKIAGSLDEFIDLAKQMNLTQFRIRASQIVTNPSGSDGGFLCGKHQFAYTVFDHGGTIAVTYQENGDRFNFFNNEEERKAANQLYDTGKTKALKLLGKCSGSIDLYLEEYRDRGRVIFYSHSKKPFFL